jgi:hypothetical protein
MTTLQIRSQVGKPVERKTLTECLKLLGVSPDKKRSCNPKAFMLKAGRQHSFSDNSEGRLYDLYEKARPAFLGLCKRNQIHLASNHETGVWINALWSRTVKLFRRKGIEI